MLDRDINLCETLLRSGANTHFVDGDFTAEELCGHFPHVTREFRYDWKTENLTPREFLHEFDTQTDSTRRKPILPASDEFREQLCSLLMS